MCIAEFLPARADMVGFGADAVGKVKDAPHKFIFQNQAAALFYNTHKLRLPFSLCGAAQIPADPA